jgi:hypothetical protein
MPAAFLSYVRELDASGDVTRFRQSLEAAVREHGWKDFTIFQGRRDIGWGDDWQERVVESLDDLALLIPIVSPGFIKSEACEFEVEAFLNKKRRDELGVIFPVYFVTTPELGKDAQAKKDWMRELSDHAFLDFRELRNLPDTDPEYRRAVNSAAEDIDKLLRRYRRSAVAGSKNFAPRAASKLAEVAPKRRARVRPRAESVHHPGGESIAPESAGKGASPPSSEEEIWCRIFAPSEIRSRGRFLVQVYLHLGGREREATDLAEAADRTAEFRTARLLDRSVREGAHLTLHLQIDDFEIKRPIHTIAWRRRTCSADFAIRAPRRLLTGSWPAEVRVSLDGVPIGRLTFMLRVRGLLAWALRQAPQRTEIQVRASAARKAFASYASTDRVEVLKRVQMLSAAGIEVFQDVISLDPGARWERELYKAIDQADLFLLFWSTAARRSKYVRKEIDYALRRQKRSKGPPDIVPVIIEGPPPPRAPRRLRHLHFNDHLLYLARS